MDAKLAAAIANRLGEGVTTWRALSGGDINVAYRVDLASGRRVFIKSHPRAPRGMFPAEARGLLWLGEAESLRVPQVYSASEEDEAGPAWLALEYVESSPPRRDFDHILGRGLAALHRFGAPQVGLDHGNFIGTLPQDNQPCNTWTDFYREKRLQPLVTRASGRGLFDAGVRSSFDRLFDKLGSIVGPTESTSRLHGDLWGGNLHVDEQGRPCLIDPAVYGGHREIDLAMMRLFGGFGHGVFDAYQEAWPLAPGHEARVALYQLYPLLVHVNLFGGSYVGAVTQALRQALRS